MYIHASEDDFKHKYKITSQSDLEISMISQTSLYIDWNASQDVLPFSHSQNSEAIICILSCWHIFVWNIRYKIKSYSNELYCRVWKLIQATSPEILLLLSPLAMSSNLGKSCELLSREKTLWIMDHHLFFFSQRLCTAFLSFFYVLYNIKVFGALSL